MAKPKPIGWADVDRFSQPPQAARPYDVRPMSLPERALLATAPRLGPAASTTGTLLRNGVEGTSAYAGANGVRAEQTRLQYNADVARLKGNDNAGREALKTSDRLRTPAPQRYLIEAIRPDKGPGAKSVGGANRTNPRVTAQARTLGKLGRGSFLTAAILGAADIAGAKDKPRAAAGVGGSIAGGWLGGIAGAETGGAIGSFGGPWGALGGAIVGGLAGSFGGGVGGHAVGEQVYERVSPGRK